MSRVSQAFQVFRATTPQGSSTFGPSPQAGRHPCDMIRPVIISASRRTDIPALYTPWLMRRLRAGYCLVPNPFNAHQVRRVSLHPQEIEAIVFWTRNPHPLLPYLDELEERGYRFYFQISLLGYPKVIEPHSPSPQAMFPLLRRLSERLGPARVIWRYDPLLFTALTPPDYHRRAFAALARGLRGSVERVVLSVMHPYAKLTPRLERLAAQGAPLLWNKSDQPSEGEVPPWLASLVSDLAQMAAENDMTLVSCAETLDLRPYGVHPGRCIDPHLLNRLFGLALPDQKDPGQRPTCGCAPSVDIGLYNTCPLGCVYCYANVSFARAWANYRRHEPQGEALLPLNEASPLAD